MWKRQFLGIFGIFWDMALFPWNSLVTMKCQIFCATPPPWEPCQASEAYGQMKDTFSWDMEWPYFGKHARTIPFERTLVMSQKSLPNTLRDPSSGRGGSGSPIMTQNLEGQTPPQNERRLSANELDTLGVCQMLVPSREDYTFSVPFGFWNPFFPGPSREFVSCRFFPWKKDIVHAFRVNFLASKCLAWILLFIGEHLHPPDLLLCVSVTCKDQSVWPNL